MLLLDEGARLVQVFAGIVHVGFAGGVAVGDFVEDFADDGVFAVVAGELGVVLVAAGKPGVQRQGELEHAGAHGGQFALGLLQGVVGFGAALQRVAEFTGVDVAAEAPVIVVAAAETVLEVLVELGHGVKGGRAPIIPCSAGYGRHPRFYIGFKRRRASLSHNMSPPELLSRCQGPL